MSVFVTEFKRTGRSCDSQRPTPVFHYRPGLTRLMALLTLAIPVSLVAGAASAATPTRSTQSDLAGFPAWYEDANGIRVGLCYDPNDANCVAPVSATYNPALPLAFPGNYPDELFYSAADSALVIVDDSASCPNFQRPAAVAGAGSRIHMALEAAFLNGALTPGDQMVFGRLRVISRAGNGLCPGAWYTFRTPYGPITLQTDGNAEIQGAAASAATNDVGCLPGPVSPCDFNLALGAPVLNVGLLHQVDNLGASTAAPGYLGTGIGLSTVTGGQNGFNRFEVVKWPTGVTPSGQGVGVDCHDAGCTVLGATDQFSVAAQLAGPIGSVASMDFGGQLTSTTSAAKSIALTNLGSGPLGKDASVISGVSISGANASDFAVSANDCPATALARDAGCNVAVTYTPGAAGVSVASLDVSVEGSPIVHHIALKGTGTTAGQVPVAAYTPADGNVAFGGVRLTTAGALQTVTVTNTGTAPLSALPSLSGSPSFKIANENCSAAFVPAGGSCSIGLKFIPTAVVPASGLLRIATNAASGTDTFALSGSGTGGIAAVAPTNHAVNTFPDWYQDENGLRVGQCDDPTNALCIAAPVAGGVTFPTNYPDEWFYYIAQSAPMDVSDPACNIAAGPIFVEAGMEAAFLGPIAPNQGITFGRLRFVSRGGLCPNTEYLLTHPYGRSILTTDASGQIKPSPGTTDVGCLGAPCDYSIALSAPVFEGFLTQTVRPDGYLGDPVNPSTVTGAPFIDPATGTPANYFKVERLDSAGIPDRVLGITTEFGVSGRLVGPMVASPAAEEFGGAEVGLAAAAVTRTITFINDGPFNVTLAASNMLTVEGTNATDFTIVSGSNCTAGRVLAHAQSCTSSVKFLPIATGERSASLKIHHSGANNPLAVALHGIGNSPAGTAAISASIPAVKFTDLHAGLHSESVTLKLSNVGGSSALSVGNPTLTANAPFVINGNTCTGVFVQPNEVCTLSLQFQPVAVGDFTAMLTIPSNAQSGTLSIPVTGKSTNVVTAQSASTIAAGLPSWYQDGNGVRLEPCLAQDGNCVVLADATFNPALPVVWPTNFPGESFYNLVDSELIAHAADASCGSVGGLVLLRIGTEAAFTTLPPAAGGQTIFNRVRITASGLCPATTYDFVHPYGTTVLTTDGNGDIRPKSGTFDNFNVTGSAPMQPGVLQWDPNVLPAAPVGYLGDARTLHTIVGSQYRLTPNGEPVNYFKVVKQGDGKVVGETKLFTVSGRLAGPVVSSDGTGFDFGTVEVGRNSATQSFTFTNIGATPVSALVTTLGGTHASLFAITASTCATVGALASDASCTVQVQFRPTVATLAGAKTATLTLGHNGLRSPVNVALSGNAIGVQTPALTVTPTTLAFGTGTVGTTSAAQIVTIRNSGTGDLRIGTLAVGGTNPTQYAITNTTCPNGPAAAVLPAGNSCTVQVAFRPTSAGAKPATLTVSATDAVTSGGHVAVTMPNVNVSMTGTGAQAAISLRSTTAAVRAAAGATGTTNVTITNNGTAPLNLTGATLSRVDPRWRATFTGCAAVATGRSCTMVISWNLGTVAGAAPIPAVNGTSSMGFTLVSNASNAPTITATGTRSR